MNVWRVRCIELAQMVSNHEKERMRSDKLNMWRRAKELLELAKQDECTHVPARILSATDGSITWVGCQNCAKELTDDDYEDYHGEGVA